MSATHLINAILIAAILSLSSVTAISAESSGERSHPQRVLDPRYGEALFNFYQDQYFQAITNLLVAQARSPITKQGDDPELLLGSLYLSYGMHRSAAGIFERLLNGKFDPYTNDLAWYYLGKLRYANGDFIKAVDAFNSITSTLPKSREGERLYLLSNAYLKESDYDKSAKVLDSLNGAGIWEYYARYNLGIAFLRNNLGIEGIRLLNKVSLLTPRNEEEYALRDKANIAIGYASIGDTSIADPVTYFSKVRLSGPFSNQALLGIGWAYIKNNRPKEATLPWRELSSRPGIDIATQESLIDIAYAFEQLDAPQSALVYYKNAIAAYDHDLSELTNALSAANYIDILRSGIPVTLENDGHQLTAGIQLANLPAAEYLSDLFASGAFQKAYQDYHDLHLLRNQVNQWKGKITLLQSMLEERRRRYSLNLSEIGESDYSGKLVELNSRRSALIAQLEAIILHADEQALATSKEHESLNRLIEIKDRLSTLAKRGIHVTEPMGQFRILQGLIQWDLSTEYPARLWNLKKDMHALDNAFSQTAEILSSLEKVQKSTPMDFDGFSKRIIDSDSYLENLTHKLDSSINKQERYCADLILDTLNAKKRQIGIYKSRALYAQARLYDQLSHDPDAP